MMSRTWTLRETDNQAELILKLHFYSYISQLSPLVGKVVLFQFGVKKRAFASAKSQVGVDWASRF